MSHNARDRWRRSRPMIERDHDPLMALLDEAVADTGRVKGAWLRWHIARRVRREELAAKNVVARLQRRRAAKRRR